jgi:hypothetical protein
MMNLSELHASVLAASRDAEGIANSTSDDRERGSLIDVHFQLVDAAGALELKMDRTTVRT